MINARKKAYAIMATIDRMHWPLATSDGFDFYTDRYTLIFLFDPLRVMSDLSQIYVQNVLQWAIILSAYNYTCMHIKCLDNVWPDLLGRWSAPLLTRR